MTSQSARSLKSWVGTGPLFDVATVGVPTGVAVDLAESIIADLSTATGLSVPPDKRQEFKIDLVNIVVSRMNQCVGIVPTPGEVTSMIVDLGKLAKLAEKLDDAFDKCDPRAHHYFSVHYDASIGVARSQAPNIEIVHAGLTQISAVAQKRVEELKRQREGAQTMETLVSDLITTLYTKTFGKDGVSRNALSKGAADGPYVRFMIFVEASTNPLDEPPLKGEAIASARRRRREASRAGT